ncbi:MAG: hypothetical protein B9S32_01125 [Verrucomicrobia bacterium Tous-C9LFEB]|nr:MAG: hypothetical protein B9S32_01125 [Verrucomicrobia bacterium Tous-C9LFEB]
MSKTNRKNNEIIYTICPVLVASHVAVAKGWLDEEIKKAGGSLKYLRALPCEDWLAHFTHTRSDFFRDGGNIPAIWTRSEGRKTKLIGLTFTTDGGQIVTRTDSGINRISDLKGKKIGLFDRRKTDRVDFWRATAERGIEVALELNGLSRKDVKIVNLVQEGPDYASTQPVRNPAEFWNNRSVNNLTSSPANRLEIDALLSGEVDAIYASNGRSQGYQATGEVKAIEDLGRYPDWTAHIANSPYTLTVSTELAEEQPQIVVGYLRAAIRAGKWIKQNPEKAAELFAPVIPYWSGQQGLAQEIAKYDFVPNLSPQNLKGIEIKKKWLIDHGYQKNDFDVNAWADSSFLDQALGSKKAVKTPRVVKARSGSARKVSLLS